MDAFGDHRLIGLTFGRRAQFADGVGMITVEQGRTDHFWQSERHRLFQIGAIDEVSHLTFSPPCHRIIFAVCCEVAQFGPVEINIDHTRFDHQADLLTEIVE